MFITDKNAYIKMLLDLFPLGLAWPRDQDTDFYTTVDATAEEFTRMGVRSGDLINELDPRTALESLPDWERMLGLPDECSRETDDRTTQVRRDEILAKLTQRGAISKQYYIDIAAQLGFTITIREFRPFQVGRSRAGDPLSNGDWIFAFEVQGPILTFIYFRTGRNTVGEPLRIWGNEPLECTINKIKPAHTVAIFTFEDP